LEQEGKEEELPTEQLDLLVNEQEEEGEGEQMW